MDGKIHSKLERNSKTNLTHVSSCDLLSASSFKGHSGLVEVSFVCAIMSDSSNLGQQVVTVQHYTVPLSIYIVKLQIFEHHLCLPYIWTTGQKSVPATWFKRGLTWFMSTGPPPVPSQVVRFSEKILSHIYYHYLCISSHVIASKKHTALLEEGQLVSCAAHSSSSASTRSVSNRNLNNVVV